MDYSSRQRRQVSVKQVIFFRSVTCVCESPESPVGKIKEEMIDILLQINTQITIYQTQGYEFLKNLQKKEKVNNFFNQHLENTLHKKREEKSRNLPLKKHKTTKDKDKEAGWAEVE